MHRPARLPPRQSCRRPHLGLLESFTRAAKLTREEHDNTSICNGSLWKVNPAFSRAVVFAVPINAPEIAETGEGGLRFFGGIDHGRQSARVQKKARHN